MDKILRTRLLAYVAAFAAAAAGGFTLIAWGLGQRRAATFGPEYVPMAPPTAALFILLGLALAAHLRWPGSRATRLACTVAGFLALAVSGLTLLQSSLAYVVLPWDRWFADPAATAGKISPGLMSPVTAWVFVLTAGALLGETGWWAGRRWVRWTANLLAMGAFGFGGIMALSYATSAPLFYTTTSVPMALLTALTFMAFNGGLLLTGLLDRVMQKWQTHDTAAHVPVENRGFSRQLLLTGCTLGALIVLAGVYYLRRVQAEARLTVQAQLEAIAQLKADEITTWRNERLSEARFLMGARDVAHDIAALVARPDDPKVRRRVSEWLGPINDGDRYNKMLVLNAQANLLLTIPGDGSATRVSPELFARALAGEAPVFGDFQRETADPTACLNLLVPIRPPVPREGPATPPIPATPIAVIVLQMDPRHYLYPLLQHWPVPSPTAESLLVRREGEEVVFLSPLRLHPAMGLRRSIHDPLLPAALAARGDYSVREGVDYRGVPVLSASRSILDSPWTLVAKIDLAEAYAPIRKDLWQTGSAVGLLLVAVILAGTTIWRGRHASYLRRALAAELDRQVAQERLQEQEARYRNLIESIDQGYYVVDPRGRFTYFNPALLAMGGLEPAELLGTSCFRLVAEEDRRRIINAYKAWSADPTAIDCNCEFQAVNHKAGRKFWVEQTAHFKRDAQGKLIEVRNIVRDITERREHEQEIQRLNRMYRVISEVNQTIVRARSRDELFPEICRVLVQLGKFKIAWIGWLDPAARRLNPVAVAGDEHGYVPSIRISTDPDRPESRGPSGIAFREDRTYVCNDFFAHPLTAPWHARAAASGFQSSIALPLRCEGHTMGVLTVYAAEKDFFGPREVELLKETAEDVSYALDGFARDERQRAAEAAVQASEHRLQFLLTMTPAIIYSLRASGDFGTTFLSPNIREVLGYEMEATRADPGFWSANVHPEDAAAVHAAMAALLHPAGPPVITREYRFRHADGSWRWMHDETRVVRDAAGQPQELIGYWIDITTRKRSELELRTSVSLLAATLESTADGILVIGPDRRITQFNRRFVELWHIPAEILADRDDHQVLGWVLDQLKDPTAFATKVEELYATPMAESSDLIEFRDGRVFERFSRPQIVAGQAAGRVWSFRDITERQRAELALTRASAYNRSLIEASLDPLVTIGTDGRITDVNTATEAATGCTRDQLIGTDFSDYFTEPAKARAGYQQVFRDGFVRDYALDLRHRDGRITAVLYNASVYRDAQGNVTGVFAAARDITERKQAEAQLQKLSRAVEQSPTSIVITDLTGAIEYVNPWFTTLTGYTLKEVLGQNPRILQSGETPRETYTEMWATLTAGRTWRGELHNKKKNGELYTELAVIAPVFGADGRPTHYVAIKDDITERKRTEVAFRESEARFRELFDLESDAILVVDPDSDRILQANLAAASTYGCTVAELLARPNHDFTAEPEKTNEIIAILRQNMDQTIRVPFRLHRRMDGTVFPIEIGLRSFRRGGRFLYVAVIRDITEQVKAREQLQRFNTELEQQVAQRTAELAARNREVQGFLEREHQVSEMKSRFISMTSHEFRTPMTAIMGSTELLANHLDQFSAEKRAQIFERINTSLSRMTAMLDDVLTLSRVDASRTSVRLYTVNLVPLVQGMIQEVRLADRDAHPFTLRLPGENVPFVTDTSLFHHILSNLLENAVRYSPAGTPVVVGIECNGRQLRLTVEDRGIGIPAADRVRIFEPFERGSNTGHIKGTGLGLNIVKRMTELLGGTITHDPVDGGGSRFTLTLPTPPAPSPRTYRKMPRSSSSRTTSRSA